MMSIYQHPIRSHSTLCFTSFLLENVLINSFFLPSQDSADEQEEFSESSPQTLLIFGGGDNEGSFFSDLITMPVKELCYLGWFFLCVCVCVCDQNQTILKVELKWLHTFLSFFFLSHWCGNVPSGLLLLELISKKIVFVQNEMVKGMMVECF